MSRRKFLAAAMLTIMTVGLLFIANMFMSSLDLEGNAKISAAHESSRVIDVSEIKNSEEKFFILEGKPILVRKVGEDNYVVFLFLVKFSDKNVHGCVVKPASKYITESDFYPKNTVYAEECRGVFFDRDGNVLFPGSHPAALPLERLKWEWEFNAKRRIKIST